MKDFDIHCQTFGEEIVTIFGRNIFYKTKQKIAKNSIKIIVDMLWIKVTTGFDYFSSIKNPKDTISFTVKFSE